LRFSGGDENKAAEFALEQQRLAQERYAKDEKRRAWNREQKRYGVTAKGRPVNMEALEQLQGMLGYSRPLIALSLQQTENSGDAALDLLTNEDTRDALQSQISKTEEKQAKTGGECDLQDVIECILSDQLAPSEVKAESGVGSSAGAGASSSAQQASIPRTVVDTELERHIADGVEDDPLAAYDVDVTAEGEAIQKYLDLLE